MSSSASRSFLRLSRTIKRFFASAAFISALALSSTALSFSFSPALAYLNHIVKVFFFTRSLHIIIIVADQFYLCTIIFFLDCCLRRFWFLVLIFYSVYYLQVLCIGFVTSTSLFFPFCYSSSESSTELVTQNVAYGALFAFVSQLMSGTKMHAVLSFSRVTHVDMLDT